MNFSNLGHVCGSSVTSISQNPTTNEWAIVTNNGYFGMLPNKALEPMHGVGLKGGWTLNMAAYDMDASLYAVGRNGNLGMWTGSGWNNQGLPGGWTMGMIAFDPTNTMWGVGKDGNLGKYNGAAWKDYGFPGNWKLRAIAFRFGDTDEVYCVAQDGKLGKYEFDTKEMMPVTCNWALSNLVFSPDGDIAYGIGTEGNVGYFQINSAK